MSELSFAEGAWRYVAAASVVVLVVLYSLDVTRRRRALERIGHLPQLERMIGSLSPQRRLAKAMLLITSVALVITSLARPWVEGDVRWQKRGIDIAIVMDYSKSMMARDVRPSRVERMEREVMALLADERLANDRIAIVVFAGAAVHFPLTHDHAAATLLFDGLTPMEMPPGSRLGDAIAHARCLVRPDQIGTAQCVELGRGGHGGDPLERRPDPLPEIPTAPAGTERAQAIVVFTDGEQTDNSAGGEIAEAVDRGIEVYLVGVGTPSGELIPRIDPSASGPLHRRPVLGWRTTADGKSFVFTRLEEGALQQLARIAGGDDHYRRMDPVRIRTDALVDRLEKLKQGDLDERMVAIPRHVFQWLLFPAFMMLLIEAVLSERRGRWRL